MTSIGRGEIVAVEKPENVGTRTVWESNGSVYTRPWVVEFILDLCGYTPDKDLVSATAVEPCCGDGEFLEGMVSRLSESCRGQGRDLEDCAGSLLAVDVDPEAVSASRARVETTLVKLGWGAEESKAAAERWLLEADFLLDPEIDLVANMIGGVDFVFGNPPYVRLEAIGEEKAQAYRGRYETMTGRADLYVAFYERALKMLRPDGVCGFICADRWMLNQYGAKLRKLITTGGFAVEAVVEMHRANAFRDDVLAYPAVTAIRRGTQGRALVARLDRPAGETPAPQTLAETATRARTGLLDPRPPPPQVEGAGAPAVVVNEWFSGADPWPCVSPERLALLKRLEAGFRSLEDPDTATKVGIGVATGADRVFITRDPGLVEKDRLLPIALAKDIRSGELRWSGHYLVNPWEADGSLADPKRYPRLRDYLREHEDTLRNRNVGKRNPERWFRTIDKIKQPLLGTPKLLIPDIKGTAHPVLDEGTAYPHHNLYHVTSEVWDLKVLGGLLLSRVGQFFIECYSVRMSGGFWRFQAQYLRRIRVPNPDGISAEQAGLLRRAFEKRDVEAATVTAFEVYGMERIPS